MYRRRGYRRSRRGPKQNYQIERPYFSITGQTMEGFQTVIAPVTTPGVRKVKNFSIDFSSPNDVLVVWALVYVPAGYQPNALVLQGQQITTMYTPTNNVIMAGMYDAQDPGNTARRVTRLSRKLNAGDQIVLVYAKDPAIATFRFIVTYAITV